MHSLTLFWLAESVQWIFEISTYDVITADYIIIMSRATKVTGYHVMYDCSAWFLWVIMSSLCALCWLPSVKKQNHDFYFFFVRCILKQSLDPVFVISRIIKVSVRVISLSLLLLLFSYLFLIYFPICGNDAVLVSNDILPQNVYSSSSALMNKRKFKEKKFYIYL